MALKLYLGKAVTKINKDEGTDQLTRVRMDTIKKRIMRSGQNMERSEPSCIVGRNVKWYR